MKAQISELAYEHYGNGIPILFIHGYPLSRRLWGKQLSDLSDIARVIAPDLRGFGESQSTKGIYTMEILAEDCKYLLDTLVIEQPVILCGLSMGGFFSLAFYKKYRMRVAGMILASTRAGSDSPEAKANRESAIAKVKEDGTTPILDGMLSKLLASTTPHAGSVETMLDDVEAVLTSSKLVHPGQQVVLICGYPVGQSCPTNMAILHTVGSVGAG